jgi:hypothetical protein
MKNGLRSLPSFLLKQRTCIAEVQCWNGLPNAMDAFLRLRVLER